MEYYVENNCESSFSYKAHVCKRNKITTFYIMLSVNSTGPRQSWNFGISADDGPFNPNPSSARYRDTPNIDCRKNLVYRRRHQNEIQHETGARRQWLRTVAERHENGGETSGRRAARIPKHGTYLPLCKIIILY